MPWQQTGQSYDSMPCVRDVPAETPSYISEDRSSLGTYPYASNPDPVTGYSSLQYNNSSVVPPSDQFRFYPQQQQSYQLPASRETPYVWVGTNNFDYSYPTCSHRTPGDPTAVARQAPRRQTSARPERSSRKRRAPSMAQRRAANIRERRRMYNLNEAFDCLRQRIPTFAYEKRLSRIETLRLAISYISFMTGIVNGEDPSSLRVRIYESPTDDSTAAPNLEPSLEEASLEDEQSEEEEEEDETEGDIDDIELCRGDFCSDIQHYYEDPNGTRGEKWVDFGQYR